MVCPKCNSPNWDYANVGVPKALVCLDCGNLYGDNRMNESEFEDKFDRGDLDCAFAEFLFDRYDAYNEHKLEALWQDEGAYSDFKDSMVTDVVVEKQQYSLGPNPLDKFPSMWSSKL